MPDHIDTSGPPDNQSALQEDIEAVAAMPQRGARQKEAHEAAAAAAASRHGMSTIAFLMRVSAHMAATRSARAAAMEEHEEGAAIGGRPRVKLDASRDEIHQQALGALLSGRRVFRAGQGDDMKLTTVLTRADLVRVDPRAAEEEDRREARRGRESESGDADQLMSVSPVTLAIEVNACGSVTRKVEVSGIGKVEMPTDFPVAIAVEMIASKALNALPEVIGVAHVPIINENGEMFAEPGYDPSSMRWVSTSVRAVAVPDAPTREDAESALALLHWLLREYEFDGPRNKVAGVGCLMTAVLRASMRKAPLWASTSGMARTGKDRLLRTCSTVSTGGPPVMYAFGKTPEERDKRLSQVLHSGAPFIVMSNINGGIESDDLCVFLSEGSVVVRQYGSTGSGRRAQYGAFWSVSGNNFEPRGDLVARCVTVRQVSSNPDPGLRVFEFDDLKWLRDPNNRRSIVAAVFTIAKWWMQERARGTNARLGGTNGFDEWSALVREPLFALTDLDIFASALEADREQRTTGATGSFSDSSGNVLAADWRVDYPWSQAEVERIVGEYVRGDLTVEAPPRIQFLETLTEEHAGPLDDAAVCAAVAAHAPVEFVCLAGDLTRAAKKVRNFIQRREQDAEHGGDDVSAAFAEWAEQVRGAIAGIGNAATSDASAGTLVKKALDVAGGEWSCGVARDPFGAAMKGGTGRAKALYRWRRIG